MKKYFLYRHIAILVSAVVLLGSCKKFLDDQPKTSITTGNAYNTATDIDNALTGAYNIFYGSDFYQWE